MRSITKILVAVRDPAARAPAALLKAAALAAALGAQLELFHALCEPVMVEPFNSLGEPAQLKKHEERAAARLQRLAATLALSGGRVTSVVAWDFPAHEAIIRHAQRSNADLIIAGGQALKHTAPWLLRFTDWELLRESPVPVLLVKRRKPWRRPRVLAAVDPAHAYGKTGQLDGDILGLAQALRAALRGSLDAVHAYTPLPERFDAAMREKLESDARRSLRELVKSQHIAAARLHLKADSPVEAIQEVVRKQGIDIVVLGTLSRSGVKRIVIGNTAEKLLDALTCDVLVVKPANFVSGTPRALRGVRLLTPSLPGMA
jgi:universal stress protein E